MFSDNLRKLREFRNMDKAQLARKLDISSAAVGQFENGKREPSLQTLKKISELFGVTIDTLLKDEKDNATKIKELINKFKYTVKEFAMDINEPVSEIEKIVINNVEPSQKIIDSICYKYGISKKEFEGEDEYEIFCRANENRELIEFAMFIKNEGYDPENIKKLVKVSESTIQTFTEFLSKNQGNKTR